MLPCWCGAEATTETLGGDDVCEQHVPLAGLDPLDYAFMAPLDDEPEGDVDQANERESMWFGVDESPGDYWADIDWGSFNFDGRD